MQTAHTYKEMMEIAGNWTTVNIQNDYVTGADHFTLTYFDKQVYYQNNDVLNVAGMALNYNGMSNAEYKKFYNEHIN